MNRNAPFFGYHDNSLGVVLTLRKVEVYVLLHTCITCIIPLLK